MPRKLRREKCKDKLTVVVFGTGGVGKSALTARFVEGCFINRYDPTIEDSYQKIIQIDEIHRCKLDILDTAGTDQFAAMRELYMRDGDVFLLVYSITSSLSFEEVKLMHDQLVKVNPVSATRMMLLGNKCDLDNEREVDLRQGEELAAEWSVPYLETSAKNGTNVDEAFTAIPRKIMQSQPPKKSNRSCCNIS